MSEPVAHFTVPKAPWPLRPFEWLISKVTDSNIAASESAVHDHERFVQVQRWTVFRYFILLGIAGVVVLTCDLSWWGSVGLFVMMLYAVQGASGNLSAARKYMSGWLAGRGAMIRSLKEASEREMDIEDWVQSEYERDVLTLFSAYGLEPADIDPFTEI
jgi:hypothetical protein